MITLQSRLDKVIESGAGDRAGTRRDESAALECRCDDPAAAANNPAKRMSTHCTSQGHVVYYRCDCGHPRVLLMRWSVDPTSGTSRLRSRWVVDGSS